MTELAIKSRRNIACKFPSFKPHWENKSIRKISGEVWYDIAGFEGQYQASNYARIKSVNRVIERVKYVGENNIQRRKGVMIQQFISNTGRLMVTLCKNNKPKIYQVSRLVASIHHPNPENKPEVNHIDGNYQNNWPNNLEWSTKDENSKHAKRNGLKAKGKDNGASKLNDEQVIEIFNSTETAYDICGRMKVSQSAISLIRTGKKWGWLTGKVYEKKRRDSQTLTKQS